MVLFLFVCLFIWGGVESRGNGSRSRIWERKWELSSSALWGVGRGGGDVFLEIVVNMLSIILSRPVVNQIQPDSATRVAVAITLPFSCNQLFQWTFLGNYTLRVFGSRKLAQVKEIEAFSGFFFLYSANSSTVRQTKSSLIDIPKYFISEHAWVICLSILED